VKVVLPDGKPSHRERTLEVVVPVTVPAAVLLVVLFIIVTVGPGLKLAPVMVMGRVAMFTPEVEVKPAIVGTNHGERTVMCIRFHSGVSPGLLIVRLYVPERYTIKWEHA
jgi:hypothetical protein